MAEGLLAGLLGLGGAYNQYENIGKMQDQYASTIGGLQSTLPSDVQFKPFTVTSGLGTTNVAADGSTTQNLSAQQQGLANQMFGGAGGFMTAGQTMDPMFAQQAQMFGGLASGYSPTGFNQYNLQGQYNTGFRPDTISQYGYGSGQANALANQAYALGSQGLATAGQAGAGLSGLQSQAQQQAMGMLSSLGGSTADRESEVYNRIRAMQSPEEQRQQMALEERLASQGRLGISTAQYGGTPEQLAMAKAQEEAKNQAALQAMQQAQSEQQQQYAQGTGLAGLTGQLAGQASDLQSAAQQRAQQLSNMGMSAEQINSQLQSEGLSRGIQAGGYNRQGIQMQSDLLNAALGRDIQAGQFGTQQQQVAQGMMTQDLQNQMALAQASQGALAGGANLQNLYSQLGLGMMQGGYMPYQQQLAMMQPAMEAARYGQAGRETAANLQAQLGLGGLAEQTKLEQIRGDLLRQGIQSVGGMFSSVGSNLGEDAPTWQKILLGSTSGLSADDLLEMYKKYGG